jgi:hypothetical protein
LEVIMLPRRIAISACALCLAIPAAAGASSTTDPPKARGPYGITPATLADTVKAKGPYGVTPATLADTVKAKGPYGVTPATLPHTVKAKGPYGVTLATDSHDSTGATARANGWRTAAISEATLLAALALGLALLLPARRRAVRVVA